MQKTRSGELRDFYELERIEVKSKQQPRIWRQRKIDANNNNNTKKKQPIRTSRRVSDRQIRSQVKRYGINELNPC